LANGRGVFDELDANGIFEPLYDAAEEACEALDASYGVDDPLERRSRVAEEEDGRAAQRRRQRMLLVERFADEWPEARALVVGKLRGAVFGTTDRLRWAVRDIAVDGVAAVAERVYRRRLAREEAMARLGGVGSRGDARRQAVSRVFGALTSAIERTDDGVEKLYKAIGRVLR
jgi:hypothetical protein